MVKLSILIFTFVIAVLQVLSVPVRLTGRDTREFNVLSENYERLIVPIYGPQEEHIDKICKGLDRACEVLYNDNDEPMGIIVFKTAKSNEFKDLGVEDSLEIKNLTVYRPDINKGKGYGKHLLNRACEVGREMGCKSIHLTVNPKANIQKYFEKLGFIDVGSYQEDKVMKRELEN